MTKTKTKTPRPDYKAQFEASKAINAANDKLFTEQMAKVVASNNSAVKDLREVILLKAEVTKAQALLDQSIASIEKKLRDSDADRW